MGQKNNGNFYKLLTYLILSINSISGADDLLKRFKFEDNSPPPVYYTDSVAYVDTLYKLFKDSLSTPATTGFDNASVVFMGNFDFSIRRFLNIKIKPQNGLLGFTVASADSSRIKNWSLGIADPPLHWVGNVLTSSVDIANTMSNDSIKVTTNFDGTVLVNMRASNVVYINKIIYIIVYYDRSIGNPKGSYFTLLGASSSISPEDPVQISTNIEMPQSKQAQTLRNSLHTSSVIKTNLSGTDLQQFGGNNWKIYNINGTLINSGVGAISLQTKFSQLTKGTYIISHK